MPCCPIKQSYLWAPPMPLTQCVSTSAQIVIQQKSPAAYQQVLPSWAPARRHLFLLLTLIVCARRARGCEKGSKCSRVPHSVEPPECFLSTLPSLTLLHITLTWLLNVVLCCTDTGVLIISALSLEIVFPVSLARQTGLNTKQPVSLWWFFHFSQHLRRQTPAPSPLYSTSSASTYF